MAEPDLVKLPLTAPIERATAIDRQTLAQLHKLKIYRIVDALFFFPRNYDDYSNIVTIPQLRENELQTVTGVICSSKKQNLRNGKVLVGMTLVDQTGHHMELVWFNQAYRYYQILVGQKVSVSGKPLCKKGKWSVLHPIVTILGQEENREDYQILPLYPLTAGLNQWKLRKILKDLLSRYVNQVEESFPPEYLERWNLYPIGRAIYQIHLPDDRKSIDLARRRFIFQELLLLQLALGVRRHQIQWATDAPAMNTDPAIDSRIRRLFPYDFTNGQNEAVADVVRDMTSVHPMNRLLQGDVGCGKTSVAVYAMLLAVASGYQAILMAPTEVLARQHQRTFRRLLEGAKISPTLFVGGLSSKQRQEILTQIADGSTKVIIGTQALIQEGVEFAKPGLVIIDEQHKFGVNQRAKLREGHGTPHYLVMTATPIPRTITMSLFGDLDVSTIKDLPPGRQSINTYLINQSRRNNWYAFMAEKLDQGRQAYIVVPHVDKKSDTESEQASSSGESNAASRVSESATSNGSNNSNGSSNSEDQDSGYEVANMISMEQKLKSSMLGHYRMGMVHGRMSTEEKEKAMDDFRMGETQILLCTSVIEVGVDVPNATLMTIESAQQFGLSQLHQLRGRISRGKHPGFCGVFIDCEDSVTLERIDAFTTTTDGFKLAEIDFRLRGPGNLFGNEQSGLPPFHIADLREDREILEQTRVAAEELFKEDEGLSNPKNRTLRNRMLIRYGAALDIADVG